MIGDDIGHCVGNNLGYLIAGIDAGTVHVGFGSFVRQGKGTNSGRPAAHTMPLHSRPSSVGAGPRQSRPFTKQRLRNETNRLHE
jgi:hypothetical protein